MQLAFEPWGGMGIQFLLPLTIAVIAWLPARRNYVFQLMGVFKSLSPSAGCRLAQAES